MLIYQLIRRFLRHKDDVEFYKLQARDAITWLRKHGVKVESGVKVLDLGCGNGIFGGCLQDEGCEVVYADEFNQLFPPYKHAPFVAVDITTSGLTELGQFDLVLCCNVLEHLHDPTNFLTKAHRLLAPGGVMYLNWTNWLSPWGGHEFSPWHYFGPKLGPLIYDRLSKRSRFHTPGINLFPTYIGEVLRVITTASKLEVKTMAPRYYTEFALLMRIPVLREFLAWNSALILKSKYEESPV